MRGDRRRAVEWGKDLAILLLTLAALVLIALSPLSQWLSWEEFFSGALGQGEDASPLQTGGSQAALQLRAAAVVNDNGRCGLQYDSGQGEQLLAAAGSLLAEALGSAKSPQPLSEGEWRAALGRTGVYFQLWDRVPLPVLTGWLREGEENTLLSHTAQRILLAADGAGGTGVALYYQDADSGEFYLCQTALDTALHLEPALGDYAPNGAVFAFEEETLSALEPYTLVTPSAPSPQVYAASLPVTAGESAAALLSACSFSTQSLAYTTQSGMVYKEGEDTLRVDRDGAVHYHAGEGSARYVLGQAHSQSEAINGARQLAWSTVGAFCGEAQLYLMDSVEGAEGSWTITFGYTLGGTAVSLPEEGWAARFLVEGGRITGFTLRFRSYQATGSATLVLPVAQAAAAMDALDLGGSQLTLRYQDGGGDTVAAGWTAG